MSAATVTQAYLLGIRDERALMREMQARGEYDPAIDAPAMLASVQRTKARGFSGDMAEYMRGGIDFWRGQVAKLKRAQAKDKKAIEALSK